MRVYPLNRISKGSRLEYIFSPLEDNRIWVMPDREESFEINLATGVKTLLSDKFGDVFFKTPLQTGGVMADTFDTSLCWFFSYKSGIFRYNKKSRKGALIDMGDNQNNGPYGMLQSAKEVWVGTASGLWRYDRTTEQCRRVDKSPPIGMERLEIDQRGRILTGGKYAYDPVSNCWELSDKNPEQLRRRKDGGHYHKPFDLPKSRSSYRFAWNADEVWACNPYYWVLNEQTSGKTTIYTTPFPAMPVSIRADANHVFGLYNDTFLVVSRTFLADKFPGDQQVIARWKRFYYLKTDSLPPQENDTWAIRKQKINFLMQQIQGEPDKELADLMRYLMPEYYEFADESKKEQALADTDITPDAVSSIYAGLLYAQVRRGDLHQALKNFQVFKARLPDDAFFQDTHTWNWVATTVRRLDSLDRAGLAPDALLWHKGNVTIDLCVHCGYFTGEACYNLTLADSIFRLLVQKYPASEYADNADYELIWNGTCHEGEDGSDHPEEVEAWKKFIKKYPDSEKRPYAMMNMAWALSRSEADLRKGLSILDEVARLRPDWPAGAGDVEDASYFLSIRREFQQQLDVFEMQVSVVLKKRKVHRGEPVELTFVLKNTGAKPKTARLWQLAGYPNFSVDIQQQGADSSCVRPLIFEDGVAGIYPRTATDLKEMVLKSGESYRESWDIARTARKMYDARVGHFIFDQPGKFRIWAKCENGMGEMDEPVLLEVE